MNYEPCCIKAALINIFMRTMNEITMCKVKAMNPQRIITRLCSSPYCYALLSPLSSAFLLPKAGSCFQQTSSDKPTVHYLPSTKQQADTVTNQLVNIVEHLAAKEPHISLWDWWRPKPELKGELIWDFDSPETWILMLLNYILDL